MYNDTLQGKARHLGIIMGGTPTSVEDRRRGVFSYEALRSRLDAGPFCPRGHEGTCLPPSSACTPSPTRRAVDPYREARPDTCRHGYTPALTELDLAGFLTANLDEVSREPPYPARGDPRLHRAFGHCLPELTRPRRSFGDPPARRMGLRRRRRLAQRWRRMPQGRSGAGGDLGLHHRQI